ncbi:L-ascorbate oxidase homolog [Linum perenne]
MRFLLASLLVICWSIGVINGEDPYIFFTWKVTYGTRSPLGTPQQVILINDEFPGPNINSTTNNNVVVNVFNNLDEPLLLTWSGVQQRKNCWMDGMPGTNCPILPGTNWTYHFQVKDQIGSFIYYPSLGMQKAAGGFGGLRINSRLLIPVPYPDPEDDYTVIINDWFTTKSHNELRDMLDAGKSIGKASGVLINGKNENIYDSLDIHVGGCMAVLVTANQEPKDYYMVASTRFTKQEALGKGIIRYEGGKGAPSPDLPPAPVGWAWSLNQFRSFKWNLTASAARPNPQGSYHYGQINITRTLRLANSVGRVNGKLRYGINGVSHVDAETPLKLAEYYGVADKVFKYDTMKDTPPASDTVDLVMETNCMNLTFRNFIEIVFENHEKTVLSYHLDGYSFFAVG